METKQHIAAPSANLASLQHVYSIRWSAQTPLAHQYAQDYLGLALGLTTVVFEIQLRLQLAHTQRPGLGHPPLRHGHTFADKNLHNKNTRHETEEDSTANTVCISQSNLWFF